MTWPPEITPIDITLNNTKKWNNYFNGNMFYFLDHIVYLSMNMKFMQRIFLYNIQVFLIFINISKKYILKDYQ